MNPILQKYAQLLVNYCLEIKDGDRVFVESTTLAEPLVREVYRAILKAGGHPEIALSMRGEEKIFFEEANEKQLEYVSPFYEMAMETFDVYLHIRAPFNLRQSKNIDTKRIKVNRSAKAKARGVYMRRLASGEMRRSLCQYPTIANAQEAGMSLEDYEHFVYSACNLFADDPVQKWLEVRSHQQKIVDLLNNKESIRYKGEGIDINFSTNGRTWINSDGRTNMPSGEVYTSPVEDSVNGTINFSYPAIIMGNEVEGVTLWVKDGEVQKWEAKRGQSFLDNIFEIEGAKRFGEAAIGTNTSIKQFTKNILFDEKIGGTVHMAIGQSYLQTGGKNQSAIHLDMIAEMRNGGEIYADDELIYKNGKFLFI